MIPLENRPPFDPSRGFVVRTAIYSNGRHLKSGDRFDPRAAECDDRRVRMLWEHRYIDCLPPEPAASAPAAPPAKEKSGKGRKPAPDVLSDAAASEHET